MKKTVITVTLLAALFGFAQAAAAGSIRIQIGAPYIHPAYYCPPAAPLVRTYYQPNYIPRGYYYPPIHRVGPRYYTPYSRYPAQRITTYRYSTQPRYNATRCAPNCRIQHLHRW